MLTYDRKVTIGSGTTAITLNDFSNHTKFYKLTNAAEFLDSPPPRSTQTPKQGEHGITDSLSFYGGRTFPFVVEIHAPTVLERQQMERALRALLSLPLIPDFASTDGYIPLEIEEEDGSILQTTAKIASDVAIEYYETGNNAYMRQRIRTVKFFMISRHEFLTSQALKEEIGYETFLGTNFEVVEGELPLVPFDLYQTGAASVVAVNDGWYGAFPIIRIWGPTNGPIVENTTTGGMVDLNGLVLADNTEYVDIDFQARTVVLHDGSDMSGYITSDSNWFFIAPGSNDIELRDDTPDELEATMRVQWRDTFV